MRRLGRRDIGLIHVDAAPGVITGEGVRHMSDTQLQLTLDAPEIIFARVQPDQKMRIVEALKRKREIIAVTGYGVNDAPALRAAHIGVAMGVTGTNVAREAADIVLLDDNFASIVAGVEEGRAVFDNIRRFLAYILAHNVPEVVPYLAFALFKVPLAPTPIQILAIDMGTDSFTALGLSIDKPDPRIMKRPPRRRRADLCTRALAQPADPRGRALRSAAHPRDRLYAARQRLLRRRPDRSGAMASPAPFRRCADRDRVRAPSPRATSPNVAYLSSRRVIS